MLSLKKKTSSFKKNKILQNIRKKPQRNKHATRTKITKLQPTIKKKEDGQVNNKTETIQSMQVLDDAALPDTSVYKFMS